MPLEVDCKNFKDFGAEVVGYCNKLKKFVVAKRDCIGVGHEKCREPLVQVTVQAAPPKKPSTKITKNPRPPAPPADAATVQRRREVCEACPSNQGVIEKLGTVRVKCEQCKECGRGRSLTAAGQTCPVGKW